MLVPQAGKFGAGCSAGRAACLSGRSPPSVPGPGCARQRAGSAAGGEPLAEGSRGRDWGSAAAAAPGSQ